MPYLLLFDLSYSYIARKWKSEKWKWKSINFVFSSRYTSSSWWFSWYMSLYVFASTLAWWCVSRKEYRINHFSIPFLSFSFPHIVWQVKQQQIWHLQELLVPSFVKIMSYFNSEFSWFWPLHLWGRGNLNQWGTTEYPLPSIDWHRHPLQTNWATDLNFGLF